MTNSTVLAVSFADRWHDFWRGSIGDWILARGVPIALYLIGGLLAARFINWAAQRIVRRIDAEYPGERPAGALGERQAPPGGRVGDLLGVGRAAVRHRDRCRSPRSSPSRSDRSSRPPRCSAPRSVSARSASCRTCCPGSSSSPRSSTASVTWFQLTRSPASTTPAEGTVEDVTLRVTKLRSTEGEMFTIPNGQIVKTVNLSQGLGARGRRHPGPHVGGPQRGQRRAARGGREGDGGREPSGAAAWMRPS